MVPLVPCCVNLNFCKYYCLESAVDVDEAEHCLDHGVVLVEEEEDDGVREGRLLGHLTRLQDPLVQQGQHASLLGGSDRIRRSKIS